MIKIAHHSGIYTLFTEQYLNTSLEKAWDFFSSPHNLSKITPSHMGFDITSNDLKKMYPGQIITYTIGLLPGIKSSWVTEITTVKEKDYFIDEQRFGPYKMWHHEHHFKLKSDRVLMTDKVSYKLPLGSLGRIAQPLIIKPQLVKIFSHRYEVLNRIFNNA